MAISHLIVGLGNPGRQYQNTRHNIGFAVIDELVRRQGGGVSREKFTGEQWELPVGRERVLVVRPLTFMNLSGSCVLPTRDFYKIADDRILVICDDLSLPVAKLRLRARGSAGGQKGLADILRRLGTEQVPRLRLGIGATPPGWETADYVLSRFESDERELVTGAVTRAGEAVIDWVERGLEFSMNKYNAS
ncbi:MAG: aminoacyl-tRNA hydrolase [Planctomycetota bacterium]